MTVLWSCKGTGLDTLWSCPALSQCTTVCQPFGGRTLCSISGKNEPLPICLLLGSHCPPRQGGADADGKAFGTYTSLNLGPESQKLRSSMKSAEPKTWEGRKASR